MMTSCSLTHLFIFLQVCDVYKLHRETFYLGQDYFDRFMATQENVMKTTLQLIGISCLFIAAKMEVWFPDPEHTISVQFLI